MSDILSLDRVNFKVNQKIYPIKLSNFYCQAQGQGQGQSQRQRQTSKLDPEVGIVMGWPTTHPPTKQLFLSCKLGIKVR